LRFQPCYLRIQERCREVVALHPGASLLEFGQLFLQVRRGGLLAHTIRRVDLGRRTDAGELEHGEHQEHREQEQRHRADEAGALAGDVAAGQLARLPRQQRQRAPDLAVEVEDAMSKVVEERVHRAVDVRCLAARVAVRADQRGAAVEAGALVRLSACPGYRAGVRRLARCGFDGAREHAAFDDAADCFDPTRHAPILMVGAS
jgi:HAMP domain-containing protein